MLREVKNIKKIHASPPKIKTFILLFKYIKKIKTRQVRQADCVHGKIMQNNKYAVDCR